MNEPRIDQGDKPEICTRCRCHSFNCAISERLDPTADRCPLFAANRPPKPSRCTVSWSTRQGQRRFVIQYPDGSVITGMIKTEDAQ